MGLLSVSEVAGRLGVGEATVNGWCRDGVIDAVRDPVAFVWQIDEAVFDRFVASEWADRTEPRTTPLPSLPRPGDVVDTTLRNPRSLRLYAPPVKGLELHVIREAQANTVEPGAPIGEANPRGFSALADKAVEDGVSPQHRPLTDEDRAALAEVPEPSADEVARMIAAAKANGPVKR